MSQSMRSLAERLRDREPLRFLFVKMPAPAEVELAGAAGFDAVIVDTEHGPDGGSDLEHHLRAASAAGVPALVRVPDATPGPILRALDAGAAGIVVAHVTDASVAAAVVSAAHYPPRGHRGLALSTRAAAYGTVPLDEHLRRAAEETVVIVQIEDAEAVPVAAQILGVESVDAVLIGSTDLSISLGHPGETGHPEVESAVTVIHRAATEAGVAVAVVCATADEADAAAARGASIAVFVALLLMRDAFRGAAASTRASSPGPVPLVLLPGMLGTAELWDEIASRLADVTPIRFGRIDLDESVEEMAASVLASAPPRFALGGHSLGGIVALAVTRLAPERVTHLAVLNASARPPSDAQKAAWLALEERVATGDFMGLCEAFARQNLASSRPDDEGLHARVEGMALSIGSDGLLRQLSAQRGRGDARPSLGAIGCPTLVVSGALDDISSAELQQELADAIPRSQLETIGGCGHMSPLEAPERVAEFLTELIAG